MFSFYIYLVICADCDKRGKYILFSLWWGGFFFWLLLLLLFIGLLSIKLSFFCCYYLIINIELLSNDFVNNLTVIMTRYLFPILWKTLSLALNIIIAVDYLWFSQHTHFYIGTALDFWISIYVLSASFTNVIRTNISVHCPEW